MALLPRVPSASASPMPPSPTAQALPPLQPGACPDEPPLSSSPSPLPKAAPSALRASAQGASSGDPSARSSPELLAMMVQRRGGHNGAALSVGTTSYHPSRDTSPTRTASPTRSAGGGGVKGRNSACRASYASASAKTDTGPRKAGPAERAETLFGELMQALRNEWRSIRSSNLGVLSGTAIVEELLLRRIQTWVAELHTLAITQQPAAEKLAALARKLSAQELQQLQIIFDQMDHLELSDYIRLCVYNTSDPSAKQVVGDISALKTAGASRKSRSVPSGRRSSAPAPAPRFHNPAANDPNAMRFSGFLPAGHRLVATAHQVQDQRRVEAEERRKAAEAKAARAAARAASPNPDPQALEQMARDAERRRVQEEAEYKAAVLASRRLKPELQPFWLADLREQWRLTTGTRIPSANGGGCAGPLLLSDSVPLYEVPPEAALLRAELQQQQAALLHSPTTHNGRPGSPSAGQRLTLQLPHAMTMKGAGPGTPTGGAGSPSSTFRMPSARQHAGRAMGSGGGAAVAGQGQGGTGAGQQQQQQQQQQSSAGSGGTSRFGGAPARPHSPSLLAQQ